MDTRIYIQGQKEPLYTSREHTVSFVFYPHSPLCVVAINDSLMISLCPKYPAYIYQDVSAVVVSSKPMLTMSNLVTVWEGEKVAK